MNKELTDKIIFTTDDGVDMKLGDTYYFITKR